jgi:glycosyltransferase involved in cell wall biosynthesis
MSRPLRVLVLCDRLDVAGGVERFVCALASHLAREGLEVAVGTVGTPRESVRYPLDAAVRVVCGDAKTPLGEPGSHRLKAWHLLRTQWRIGRVLSGLIRQERPDVIVLNGLTTACSVLPFTRPYAGRTICCDHNHFGARSGLWQRLRERLYPQVAAVVSLTEADAARFRGLNRNTRVIYNAAGISTDAPALPSQPVVLAVGRHVAQKGFDLLLKAWATVSRTVPAARLRIVGDGPLRPEHERLAAQLRLASVEWYGPTAQVEALYRDAAVFVLPSRYEGMPLALLEAQALGVPAVAFDCPTGPGEILTADTGRLVPPGDVTGLALALVELLSRPELRAHMAHAAIARSRAVFSRQEHERRWTALVREVAVRHAYGHGTAA